jgi:hypothetical protein
MKPEPLQEALSPFRQGQRERRYGGRVFRVGVVTGMSPEEHQQTVLTDEDKSMTTHAHAVSRRAPPRLAVTRVDGEAGQYLVLQPACERVDLDFAIAMADLHADSNGEQVPVRLAQVVLSCGGAGPVMQSLCPGGDLDVAAGRHAGRLPVRADGSPAASRIMVMLARAAASWAGVRSAAARQPAVIPQGSCALQDGHGVADRLRVGEVDVIVADLADVIRSKESAGRPKDLRVLPLLYRHQSARRAAE